MNDLRGKESDFNLNDDASQTILDVSSEEHAFQDKDRIRNIYCPEVKRLLLEKLFSAHNVILFDHTIRRSDPNAERRPVMRVYIN